MRESCAEIAARTVLIVAVCAMSWAFGGVEPIAKLWLARLIGLSAVCALLSRHSLNLGTRTLPTAGLVLAAACAIGFLQLAPLSNDIAEAVSPNAVQLRSDLGVEPEATATLTISEPETRRDLSLLLLAVAAFFVASQVFQTVASQLSLCFAVAINGAALSVWGLIQQLGHRNDLLPGVPCEVNSIIFSTYVNHSSAAGFLNMCLGTAIGLLLWRYRSPSASGHPQSLSQIVSRFFRSLNPVFLLLLALTTLLVAAVGASLSRGGCLAAIAGFITIAFLISRRGSRSVGLGTIMTCVVAGVVSMAWVGVAEPLTSRYSLMVTEDGQLNDGRVGHWLDGVRTAGQFLTVGSGLGTYSSAYLTFEENQNPHWFRHAHNQYLEALVDCGIPGLLLLLMVIGMIGNAAWYLSTQRAVGVHSWFGICAVFVLASQAVQALTDFGLYLPANMLLCSVICGAVAGTAATTGNSWSLRMPSIISRPIVWNTLAFAGCVFAMNHLRGTENSSRVLATTKPDVRSSVRATPETINGDLDLLLQASAQDSSNADIHFRIARQLMQRYQTVAFDVLRSNDGLARSESELWSRASVEHLHAALVALPDDERETQIRAIMSEPAVLKNLVPAREQLLIARMKNPCRSRTHVYLAILAPLFAESDLAHLNRADLLSYTDADANFDCGLLHLRANRQTRAIESWKRCLQFSRDHAELVLSVGATRLDTETIVNEVLPEDLVLLVRLAEKKQKVSPNSRMAKLIAERALAIANPRNSGQLEYFRGRAAKLLEEENLATEHFGNAVRLQPNQLEWRYQYASALTKSGQITEAEKQIQWCLGLAPRNRKYKRLMETVQKRSKEL